MNKNLTIVLLAFATVVSGALAFWFAQDRVALQVRLDQQVAVQAEAVAAESARAAGAAEAECVALREQLAESEATVRDLRGEVSLLQAGRSRGPALGARPRAMALPRAVLSELLGKPETVGLAMDWIKADQYPRYAALIARQTHLTDAQREALRTLLAERYATRVDFSSAAAEGGAARRPETRGRCGVPPEAGGACGRGGGCAFRARGDEARVGRASPTAG